MPKRWLSVCCNRVEPFPPNKIVFCGACSTCIKMYHIKGAGGWVVGCGGRKKILKIESSIAAIGHNLTTRQMVPNRH